MTIKYLSVTDVSKRPSEAVWLIFSQSSAWLASRLRGKGHGSGWSQPSGPAVGRDIQLSPMAHRLAIGCLRQPATRFEPETLPAGKAGPGLRFDCNDTP